jgi:hypothetical protein
MLLCIVSPQKLASLIYMLYVPNKYDILRVGTCNIKLLIKKERSLLHILTHKWQRELQSSYVDKTLLHILSRQ